MERLAAWWLAGILSLSNAIWVLLLGCLGALLSKRRSAREGVGVSPAVRWGVALALGAMLTFAARVTGDLIAVRGGYEATEAAEAAKQVVPVSVRLAFGIASALGAGSLAWRRRGRLAGLATIALVVICGVIFESPIVAVGAGCVAAALAVGGRPRRVSAKGVAVAVFSGVTALLCLAGLLWAASWQIGVPAQEYASTMMSLADTPSYQAAADWAMAAIAPLSVALLMLLVLTVVGWKQGMPVSVTLTRGFRSGAVPVAGLLLLEWSAVVASTVPLEASARARIEQRLTHEGRYDAALVGEKWPGPVR